MGKSNETMERKQPIISHDDTINDLFSKIRAGLDKREREGNPLLGSSSLDRFCGLPTKGFAVGTARSTISGSSASWKSPKTAGKEYVGNGLGREASADTVPKSAPLFASLLRPSSWPSSTPSTVATSAPTPAAAVPEKASSTCVGYLASWVMPVNETEAVSRSGSSADATSSSPLISSGDAASWRDPVHGAASLPNRCLSHPKTTFQPMWERNTKLGQIEKKKDAEEIKPLSWDIPSFGQDPLKEQRVGQKRDRLDESTEQDKKISDISKPWWDSSDDPFGGFDGLNGGFGFANPWRKKWTEEEVNDFVKFADEFIPTPPKRRRLLGDDDDKKKGGC